MTEVTDSIAKNSVIETQKSLETQNSQFKTHNFIQPPELEVVNMTKRFGTMTALDNFSMTLKPGTFHALLG